MRRDDTGWWQGEIGGVLGWLPSNFCRETTGQSVFGCFLLGNILRFVLLELGNVTYHLVLGFCFVSFLVFADEEFELYCSQCGIEPYVEEEKPVVVQKPEPPKVTIHFVFDFDDSFDFGFGRLPKRKLLQLLLRKQMQVQVQMQMRKLLCQIRRIRCRWELRTVPTS